MIIHVIKMKRWKNIIHIEMEVSEQWNLNYKILFKFKFFWKINQGQITSK